MPMVDIVCPPPQATFNCPCKKSNTLDSNPKALSLGVSAYSPWDLEMAERGYEVLEFDASIKKSPYPNHPRIKFFKKFVGVQDSADTMSFERVIAESKMSQNLPNILQCDIENAEWEILEKIDIALLAQYFTQVIFEFHQCDPDDEQKSSYRFRILEKLLEYYTPVHTHFNLHSTMFVCENPKISESLRALLWCGVVEVSYVRKDCLPEDIKLAQGVYIRDVDYPNSPLMPDMPIIFP